MTEHNMNPVIAVPSAVIDIPKEIVKLPSEGRIYPLDSPLHTKELEIYSLTARGEDVLTSRNLLRRGVVLDRLIQLAIVNRIVNVDDLLLGDKNAIMVAYRITGYGSEYAVEVECPECEKKISKTYNLSKMPLLKLGADPVEDGQNKFLFVLPMTQKKVYFKLLTAKDEREVGSIIESNKKVSEIETNVTTRLFASTLEIDNITDRAQIKRIIETLPAGDSLAYRSYMADIEPNIDMVEEVTCNNCGAVSEVECPMGLSFLWPGFGRKRRRSG